MDGKGEKGQITLQSPKYRWEVGSSTRVFYDEKNNEKTSICTLKWYIWKHLERDKFHQSPNYIGEKWGVVQVFFTYEQMYWTDFHLYLPLKFLPKNEGEK